MSWGLPPFILKAEVEVAEEAGLAAHLMEDLTEEEEISIHHSLQMDSISSEDVVEVSKHVPNVETEQLLGKVRQSMTVHQYQKTLNTLNLEPSFLCMQGISPAYRRRPLVAVHGGLICVFP